MLMKGAALVARQRDLGTSHILSKYQSEIV